MTDVLDASVAILSYDRVHLLERTLRALIDPKVYGGVRHEIIVVDNHPDRKAEALVAEIARLSAAPVTYLHEPRRNISVVRNIGIKAAKGRYVAIVDDDEMPLEGWLSELVACMDRTGADAAFGPKLPEFEAGHPPAWDPEGWAFTCDFRLPPDTEIVMFGRLRRKGKALGSGNSIYRASTALAADEPFDPAFGNANGEDTQFFFRLTHEGKKFVWCPTAKVSEFMEKDRSKASYMIQRLKRGSQHYAVTRISTSKNKTLTFLKVTFLGVAQFCVHAALYLLTFEWARPNHVKNQIGMAKALGKLSWRAPIGFIDERTA